MIRRPPRSTLSSSSAASDVYKRQLPHTGNLNWLSKDPYCVIEKIIESEFNDAMFDIRNKTRSRDEPAKQTTHIPETLEPVWDELFLFQVASTKDSMLTVTLYDFARLGRHDALSVGLFPCQGMKHAQRKEGWIPMYTSSNAKKNGVCNGGSVYMMVTFIADVSAATEKLMDPRADSGKARSFARSEAHFRSQHATEARGDNASRSQTMRMKGTLG
eukprot:TRINITY_DN10327_c0_g1_i1.p1 TRINITY_DN10327_c0_g1~~TRINITY_DN10327_c0_g1_i1.p1  ORF type:complete len:216 (-),score=54.60 TRINITY_DN10327_c0_g1_i1:249-896(-)